MSHNLFEFTIDNGTLHLGKAVRYYAYQHLINKDKAAIVGRLWKSESKIEDSYENYLPYGRNLISYLGDKYQITISKTGEALEVLNMTFMHPFDVKIELIETETMKLGLSDYLEYKKKTSQESLQKIKKLIEDSKLFYDTHITEVEDKKGVIGIYIFDDYWELLNRHQPRKIDTVCLDGKEKEILEYIKKFKSPATKKRYMETGTPYKKNIMFEGFPGTGKTSLIFSLASELDCNIAIINFSKDMDDNNFMRAIRRLPKNCMLVLEDIDVLFKERKENDGFKSSLSFSALLNTLDGLAFRQGTVTVMTTNYLCNLDSALKRPGRIDKIVHFGLATKNQTQHMFCKFFPENTDDFDDFYVKIKSCKYTTAILQQYFLWHMEEYHNLLTDIPDFKKLCREHNYDSHQNIYS